MLEYSSLAIDSAHRSRTGTTKEPDRVSSNAQIRALEFTLIIPFLHAFSRLSLCPAHLHVQAMLSVRDVCSAHQDLTSLQSSISCLISVSELTPQISSYYPCAE